MAQMGGIKTGCIHYRAPRAAWVKHKKAPRAAWIMYKKTMSGLSALRGIINKPLFGKTRAHPVKIKAKLSGL